MGLTASQRTLLAAALALCAAPATYAVELPAAETLYRTGKIAESIEACTAALADGARGEPWYILKARGELQLGRYTDALETYRAGIAAYEPSLGLRLVGADILRMNDRGEEAKGVLTEMLALAERVPWRYGDAESRVLLGKAALRLGADARKVLEEFYDRAKRGDAASAEPYAATGELALLKQDYALAAESFREAVKRDAGDPDLYLGLARSFDGSPEQTAAALAQGLAINPNHVESLLFQADKLLNREAYPQASELLAKALAVNPRHPRAWAYKAVLAHLTGDAAGEAKARETALAPWKGNAEVDHLIGLKLSQNYRFAEGAAYQRRALGMEGAYLPARTQLCQDLLRLGEEEEGWALAAEVFKEDPYNILAFNLVTLRDTVAKFTTLKSEHFIVSMEPREAAIYGSRVLELLERAHGKLTAKFEVKLDRPTRIEIFPQQKDFAIRTFGLPGGEGFLGVCFGPVITVNSPASRPGHNENWEAILWHEFCHTITLTKTRNKMPRWLSEGISVYEEMQENGAWGQRMSLAYRELILGQGEMVKAGGVTPVSQLSSAFMKPPTPGHLMFAYFEASMVVRYILERHGESALRAVLVDLGRDVAINEALAKHTVPIERLDAEFGAWFKKQAEGLAPGADLAKPEVAGDAGAEALAAWNKEHPTSFQGLLREGALLAGAQKWAEARERLEKAMALFPGYAEADGPPIQLAMVYRRLNLPEKEREVLRKFVGMSADSVDARIRLIQLALADAKPDLKEVRALAEGILAINPLIAEPYRHLARAAEEGHDMGAAIAARRALLSLDPLDKAQQHFALGRILLAENQLPAARRETVMALEEAPRFREAHRLFLEIDARMSSGGAGPATVPAPASTAFPATQPGLLNPGRAGRDVRRPEAGR